MNVPNKCRTSEIFTYQLKLEGEILVLRHNYQVLQSENRKLIAEKEKLLTEVNQLKKSIAS